MNSEWLAMIMFAIFMALIVIGYPVAFSFALTAIAFTMLGLWLGDIRVQQLNALPSRWFGYISDQNLLAIPFFVYMGSIFEKSGQAERLLTAVGRLMGPLRGGLALTVVVVGTMLAAATGVVAATVIMMGLLSLPAMVRYGYDHRLATGVIAASGTLAQLIPPSLVLIVLASTTRGVSVGGLFRGAIVPGLMLSGLYALYVGYVALRYPERRRRCRSKSAGPSRVGARAGVARRHRPTDGVDLLRARRDLPRDRHTERGRLRRRGGRRPAGIDEPAVDLEGDR